MTDEAALIAAICDRPDDDTPRLVYADWLDDHGDPGRAAWVRHFCSPEYRLDTYPIRMENSVAFGCWGVRWEIPPPLRGATGVVVHVGRGFPAEIECPAAWWVGHGDALSWHPAEARPCPVTASPGLTVRLTTPVREGVSPQLIRPERSFIVGEWGSFYAAVPEELPHNSPEATKAALSARWPGVRAWHLPPPARTHQYSHWGVATGRRIDRTPTPVGGDWTVEVHRGGGDRLTEGRLTGVVPAVGDDLYPGQVIGPIAARDGVGGRWDVPRAVVRAVITTTDPPLARVDAVTVGGFAAVS